MISEQNSKITDLKTEQAMVEYLRSKGRFPKKQGDPFRCLYPSHTDLNGSANYHTKPGYAKYHCFVCRKDIDLIQLREDLDGLSFSEQIGSNEHQYKRVIYKGVSEPKLVTHEIILEKKDKPVKTHLIEKNEYVYDILGDDSEKIIVHRQDWMCSNGSINKDIWQKLLVNSQRKVSELPKNTKVHLFHHELFKKFKYILIVEGEKKAEKFNNHPQKPSDWIATTSIGGASAFEKSYWPDLIGNHRVYFWPDNDKSGYDYLKGVSDILYMLPGNRIEVYTIQTEKIFGNKEDNPKKDIADFINNTFDSEFRNNFYKIIEESIGNGWNGQSKLRNQMAIREEIKNIDSDFTILDQLVGISAPGSVTVICGKSGSRKTFFTMQLIKNWYDNGDLVEIILMEQDKTFYSDRELSQLQRDSSYSNSYNVISNPEKSENARIYWENHLDRRNKMTHVAFPPPTMEDMIKYITIRAKQGYRAIIIDPITQLRSVKYPNVWDSDKYLMNSLLELAITHKMSFFPITHPKQGREDCPHEGNMSGSAELFRFCTGMIWTQRMDEDEEKFILPAFDYSGIPSLAKPQTINQVNIIYKGKSSEAVGKRTGNFFDSKDLLFKELGFIQKEKETVKARK